MYDSEPCFIDTIPREPPQAALWQQIDALREGLEALFARHNGPCLRDGHQREHGPEKGTYTGCPRCHKDTGDPFTGWRLEIELDYLCSGGDAKKIPDYPTVDSR